MKGLGNYRFPPNEERKPAVLLSYKGSRALVRFHNGTTFAIPAAPLKKLGVKTDDRFLLIVQRVGKKVTDIRVEHAPEARPARPKGVTPKIMLKAGRRLITRR